MKTWTVALFFSGCALELVGLFVNFFGFRHLLGSFTRLMTRPREVFAYGETAGVSSASGTATVQRAPLPPTDSPEFRAKIQAWFEFLFSAVERLTDITNSHIQIASTQVDLLRQSVEAQRMTDRLEAEEGARRQIRNVAIGWLFLVSGFFLQAISQGLQFAAGG
jgi:hypothetical protein